MFPEIADEETLGRVEDGVARFDSAQRSIADGIDVVCNESNAAIAHREIRSSWMQAIETEVPIPLVCNIWIVELVDAAPIIERERACSHRGVLVIPPAPIA